MKEKAASWQLEADRVHAAIEEKCVVEGPFGPEFAEGVWRDGSWVAGHDGEETDLTLASAYGFVEADDERIINHARSAFTIDNPYFRPATGGVSWWDFHFHGPTFPAYVHALAGVQDETELHDALEVIRERTDLDGSTWWWPHLEDETDPRRVLRGPGKCGWAAGALITRLIHDIIGARVDALNRTLTFAPFTPWHDLRWTAAQLGALRFDLEHHADDDLLSAAVVNRSDAALEVRIELVVPLGRAAVAVLHDGIDATERSRRGRRFGRTVVSVARRLEPGARTALRLELAQAAVELAHGGSSFAGAPFA